MKKQFDPASQAVYLAIVTALLFICAFWAFYKGKKTAVKVVGASAVVCGIAFVIRAYSANNAPARIIKNDYTGSGCYKCESDKDCSVAPLSNIRTNTAIDGLNTGKYPGKVFKLRNGTYAEISKDGEVKPSIVGSWLGSGWKDKKYFQEQGALDQWQPLFDC